MVMPVSVVALDGWFASLVSQFFQLSVTKFHKEVCRVTSVLRVSGLFQGMRTFRSKLASLAWWTPTSIQRAHSIPLVSSSSGALHAGAACRMIQAKISVTRDIEVRRWVAQLR